MSVTTEDVNNYFFDSSYKDVWRHIIPEALTHAETDFILDIAGLDKGNRVLDLMCGYGRHSIELAKNGIEVTSIDNLKEYIEEIKRIASATCLSIYAAQANVLDWESNNQFDAVICMGNSFSFFNKEQTAKLLYKISNLLVPGGILLINSWMIAEIAIRYFKDKEWYYTGEYKCIIENEYKFLPSRIVTEQTIIANDGTSEVLKGIDYIFTLDELEGMLKEAGLKTKELYATPRKKKFLLGDARIYIVAEKIK
ncbi:MAG TPA: methyltransferase domain-containing protein [Flavisolibacter sp.]|nr:methyltransferase domain-containing protein [Flavisolibacter sp.]